MTYGDPEWRPWILDEARARPHVAAALEAGINFFDTADMYSRGRSEEVIGRLLKEMAQRTTGYCDPVSRRKFASAAASPGSSSSAGRKSASAECATLWKMLL